MFGFSKGSNPGNQLSLPDKWAELGCLAFITS